VSVDTHLKGKNLAPYRTIRHEDVALLLNPKLMQWASNVHIDAGRKVLRRRLLVDLEHQHGPHCRH
jgi:hypothetical protein